MKSLGERSAVLVGHGWGGYVAWAAAVLHPTQVTALGVVAAPHPLAMLRALRVGPAPPPCGICSRCRCRCCLSDASPTSTAGTSRRTSGAGAAAGSAFPDEPTVRTYQQAISLWPASHCALEYHRWLFRSRIRSDGRQFNAVMRHPVPSRC